MVVPGVIGQVVVAFHDMHAGKSSLQRLCTATVRYAAFCFVLSAWCVKRLFLAVKAMTRINGHVFGGRVVRGR
jgi:hypothetical protein